jgi:hypothetical protein
MRLHLHYLSPRVLQKKARIELRQLLHVGWLEVCPKAHCFPFLLHRWSDLSHLSSLCWVGMCVGEGLETFEICPRGGARILVQEIEQFGLMIVDTTVGRFEGAKRRREVIRCCYWPDEGCF